MKNPTRDITPSKRHGSFLFATASNPLNIVSISRFGSEARVLEEGQYVHGGVTFCIRMDDARYEEYIKNIAKQIPCIVIKGDDDELEILGNRTS